MNKGNKKRIIVTSSQVPFIRGGAEILIEDLTENLLKRNFLVETVSLPFKWYPTNEILKGALAWRFLDISESNGDKVDLVIATKFPSYVVEHPNKVVWLVHQLREAYDLYGSEYSDLHTTKDSRSTRDQIIKLDNRTLGEAKSIYTISKNVATRLSKYNGIVGTHLYPPPRNHKLYRAGNFGNYILSIGRLDKKKRVDLLIASLKYTDKSIKCIIVGSGPERLLLEKLVEELGLHERVEFLGQVQEEDLIELYANCFSVYYSPLDEDYGYVTVEALLSKKPVVTTNDSGGVLEFVGDGVGGLISDPRPDAIGKSINSLYANKKLGLMLGDAGYQLVKDLNWDDVVDELTKSIL